MARRLGLLTRDLLNVSSLSKGRFALRPRPIDLAALVGAVAAWYRDLLGPDHHLVVDAAVPCPVVADPDRIEQVLTNLLDNAAKYAPAGGPIRVGVAPAGDGEERAGALVTVRDEGVGLPSGAADSLFAPFGRAANVAQGRIPGLGLGLYICRNIVESHGGRIWMTSAGEGRGATVSLRLPAGGIGGGRRAAGAGAAAVSSNRLVSPTARMPRLIVCETWRIGMLPSCGR